jgi:ribosomal protein S8
MERLKVPLSSLERDNILLEIHKVFDKYFNIIECKIFEADRKGIKSCTYELSYDEIRRDIERVRHIKNKDETIEIIILMLENRLRGYGIEVTAKEDNILTIKRAKFILDWEDYMVVTHEDLIKIKSYKVIK